MPIFEYHCKHCENEFETIVSSKDISISCPECKSCDTYKLISSFSFKSSGGGSTTTSSASSCGSCMTKNCGTCS